MSKLNRFIACVTLLTFLTGCTGYRVIDFSDNADRYTVSAARVQLKEGDRIRVTGTDGAVVEGYFGGFDRMKLKLVDIADETLITRYEFDEVAQFEVMQQWHGVAVAGFVVVAGGIFLIRDKWEDSR